MRRQLNALFARYLTQHLRVTAPITKLSGSKGSSIGSIESLQVHDGRIRLTGWAQGRSGVLHIDGKSIPFPIGLRREDVAQHRNIAPEVGFELTEPLDKIGPHQLSRIRIEIQGVQDGDHVLTTRLYLPRLRLARLLVLARFAAKLMLLTPAGLGWMLTRAPHFRVRIKQGLNLKNYDVAQVFNKQIFSPGPVTALLQHRVTIIMPVYNAFGLLEEVLSRVETNTDLPWRMVLIEDGSTDHRVRPFLRDWTAPRSDLEGRVKLLENDVNRGFVHSANRGIKQALTWGETVILLNSDAFVPAGWASRLIRPIATESTVATTTPLSNDAEIFNVPTICARTDLPTGAIDRIDAVAARLNWQVSQTEVPTGVGFCMGINLHYLRQCPGFDTTFGRGYGEEVDWCQRVRALGGRHIGVPNLFVGHQGGQSFGTARKQALVTANNAIITKRYSSYDDEVQQFIANDPMQSARMAVAMAWAAAVTPEGSEVPVFMAHSMGGGAERYLQGRIKSDYLNFGQPAVVLRVGGPERWQVELTTPEGTCTTTIPDLDTVLDLLAPLTRRRVMYSCGVGDIDPVTLPAALIELSDSGHHPVEVLFHDYFPISPSYTLLGRDGIYHGTPVAGTALESDPAHNQRLADGTICTLADWQHRWGALLSVASKLVVFSTDSADHVRRTYPEVADRIVVIPHGLLAEIPNLSKCVDMGPNARRVVAVLGNIGYQKGAALLKDLGQVLSSQNIGLMVLGNVEPNYTPPPKLVPVHGDYNLSDLTTLVKRYGITDWLIPSIWPETFSYTTHEALATGLPVHAFNIGAQGSAVEDAANGFVIPFEPGTNLASPMLQHFSNYFARSGKPTL